MICLLRNVIYDDLPSKKWWFMMIYIFEMVISIPFCVSLPKGQLVNITLISLRFMAMKSQQAASTSYKLDSWHSVKHR